MDIAQRIPEAILSEVTDETEATICTMCVRFPEGLVLTIGNDLDFPESHFFVMRSAEDMPHRLAFEDAFEEGYAITETLTRQEVLDLVLRYSAFRPPFFLLH